MNLLQKFKEEKNHEKIILWNEKFEKADKIKKLAYENYYLWEKIGIDMDKRMNNVWNAVIKIEPVKTFENGILTDEARKLLNMARLLKALKK